MAGDDDIARSLPRPPFPAPARREAAIEAALRRFDGEPEPKRVPARSSPWWRGPARPYAGALAGAFLVALIALPVAWNSLPDVADRKAGDSRTTAVPEASAPGPVLADSVPEPAAAPSGASAERAESPTVELRGVAKSAPDVAAEPAPVASPPPSPEPAADSRTELADSREVAPAEPAREAPLIVTGSRIRNPNLSAPGQVAAGKSERASRSPSDRAWNACTVDDPARSLDSCRRQAEPEAKGREKRADVHIADGLSRAWNGELDGALGAFDRAIEAAPHSSAAYLNRGLAWRRRGDLDRALADLDQAVRYAPRSAAAYRARSLVLRQRGDTKRARADEARADALDRREAERRR